MHTLDASAIIHAWDTYPIDKFPDFWDWVNQLIGAQKLSIPKSAYDEVMINAPDCHAWLKSKNIHRVPLSASILNTAVGYKRLLGIANDDYHPRGVGENDLLIIATAHEIGATLISQEGRQNNLPNNKAKYKIPAVCGLPSVDTPCIDVLDLISLANSGFK